MRFGCCTSLDNMGTVQDAGYDFVELAVATVMPESSEADYAPIREKLKSFNIKPEAWNILFPPGIKVTGPEADHYRTERYLRTAFYRITDLGGEVVVFGSGRARNVPDGFPVIEARKQLVELLALLGQVALDNGITVAIEPLYKKGSNIINTIAEAMEYVEAVNHPNIKCLADFFHMDEENEPLANMVVADGAIVHVHISDTGRCAPGIHTYGSKKVIKQLKGAPAYDHQAFFKALKEIGYDARISVECRWNDFNTEVVKALQFLKAEWDKAK